MYVGFSASLFAQQLLLPRLCRVSSRDQPIPIKRIMRVSNTCEFSCMSFHGSIEDEVSSEDLAISWIIIFRLHDFDDFIGKPGCCF